MGLLKAEHELDFEVLRVALQKLQELGANVDSSNRALKKICEKRAALESVENLPVDCIFLFIFLMRHLQLYKSYAVIEFDLLQLRLSFLCTGLLQRNARGK